ncbi:MAG TPA: SufD family Fe-S cluster assembly protein [Alphaproteobacteria bacterium]|nr:SufD family Fe-S cluster assembly protein [Alphaproteobacteria bacterium]
MLNAADLEKFLPQGETALHTPLRAVRDGTWKMAEAPPLLSTSVKCESGSFVVPAGKKAELNIEWPLPGGGKVAARQLHIAVEDGAELTLLELFKGQGWAADNITITLGTGAKLTHAVVQHAEGIVTRTENISMGDNAHYGRLAVQSSSRLARLDVALTLQSNATVSAAGVNLCNANQVLDQTMLLTLNGPGNRCSVQQRNVLAAGAHSVFQGKYYVGQKAQKTDGYMLVNNLLLGDNALAFGKPELEIYADDVKCSHGASTGGLNPEQLFYMKARGIGEAAAKQLMVAGFAEELLADWPVDFIAAAQPVVHTWLESLSA